MGFINKKEVGKYQTYYGIYAKKQHDLGDEEKPILVCGWFTDIEEAKERLKKKYHNGEKLRNDNNVYGYHYTYWYEIYAFNDDLGFSPGFYDMNDYINDLLENGEWNKLTNEQKQILVQCSPYHTKLRLLLENKIPMHGDWKNFKEE